MQQILDAPQSCAPQSSGQILILKLSVLLIWDLVRRCKFYYSIRGQLILILPSMPPQNSIILHVRLYVSHTLVLDLELDFLSFLQFSSNGHCGGIDAQFLLPVLLILVPNFLPNLGKPIFSFPQFPISNHLFVTVFIVRD